VADDPGNNRINITINATVPSPGNTVVTNRTDGLGGFTGSVSCTLNVQAQLGFAVGTVTNNVGTSGGVFALSANGPGAPTNSNTWSGVGIDIIGGTWNRRAQANTGLNTGGITIVGTSFVVTTMNTTAFIVSVSGAVEWNMAMMGIGWS
jgi:hypothetical protein